MVCSGLWTLQNPDSPLLRLSRPQTLQTPDSPDPRLSTPETLQTPDSPDPRLSRPQTPDFPDPRLSRPQTIQTLQTLQTPDSPDPRLSLVLNFPQFCPEHDPSALLSPPQPFLARLACTYNWFCAADGV
uniref:Uncharacterized protein n=1 Tax=Knipowitschia caucasica TaxID=637954 RepID=A0AAV2LS10_KNICA